VASGGHPFGGDCIVASCCQQRGLTDPADCIAAIDELKAQLLAEFNALATTGMPVVTDLNTLRGAYVNLVYALPSGPVQLLDDTKVYLGNQLEKTGTERCYGLAADAQVLLVCEYGDGGSDPEIVVFKRR